MDIIPASSPSLPQDRLSVSPQPKPRPLAGRIRAEAQTEVWSDVDKKRIRKDKFFARMIWDLVTEGQTYFSSGEVLKIRSMEQWTELVKLLTNHVDGPVQKDGITNNINVFKVYNGIDESRV